MKNILVGKLFIFALVAFSAVSVSAWDDTGHKVTAYIAWQQLSPEVREKVFQLLVRAPEDSDLSVWFNAFDSRSAGVKKLELFMMSSTWADTVRNRDFKVRFEKYNQSNWHFADIFWKQEGARNEILKDFPEEGGKAVAKLYDFKETLRNPLSADSDKAIALAWLMHVGGDIHNPLHNASRVTESEPKGDLGGNLFLLSPADALPPNRLNLHFFWDSVISRNMPRSSDACDSDYIAEIAGKITARFPFAKMKHRINAGDFRAWHDEGFRLLPNTVYSTSLKRNEMPPKQYQKAAFKIGQEVIALAGYRLGEALNQIFIKRLGALGGANVTKHVEIANWFSEIMDPKRLLKYFEDRLPAINDSIREIVEIESPSFDQEASHRLVDWIENCFREKLPGLSSDRILADGCGEHLIVRAYQEMTNVKPVLILGHTDTVHPIGSTKKNPTRIEDGRFYGCGTFDMKANIALLAEVFRSFVEFDLRPARPLTVLLSCDEEVGSPSGRGLVETEARASEMCLVFEPSAAGKVKTGRKGTGNYRLNTRGIPSHAGLDPEKGASAILELSRQIERLHTMNDMEKGTTVNVCTIKGGTASNVIPEYASCEIDVRFTSVAEARRIENRIRDLQPFDKRVTIELLGEINRPPMERTEQVVELFEKARTLAAGFDYELGETQVGGASDGNFVGALGVPVLDGLGVSGNGAHTLDEYILIEDIPRRATLMAMLLL